MTTSKANATPASPGSVDSEELARHIAEMYRDVANESGRALHFCQAHLWAACIAGASQRDLYMEDIAAAGLELQLVQHNPSYRFVSERARRTSDKYGAHSVSLLALKPLRESATEEVSK